MDTKLKMLLAQDEVFRANKPYLEWPSLFSNNMVPLQKNIDSAIAYINSLSNAEIYQRQSILHWEDMAINRCNGLIYESSALLRSSIDVKRLAKLEIENINLLLEEGVDRLITRSEYSRFNRELPVLYRDLVNGRWSNFIFFEELKCSRQFHLEWQVKWLKTLKWSEQVTNEAKLKILNEYQLDWEWVPISERVNRMRELPIKIGRKEIFILSKKYKWEV